MDTTVDAIVLRRVDSAETDRRLTLLTPELGKIDAIAKGARKGGSRLAGASDPLSASRLMLAQTRRTYYITQSQPLHSFQGLRTDYDRLCIALALAELYAHILPYGQPSEEAFELLVHSLKAVEDHPKAVVAAVWAQLQLLTHSGFLPSFDRSTISDLPVQEASPFLSPRAGGYVTDEEAVSYTDRFRSRAEVLYGLARTAELNTAPPNLKFAFECLKALLPFWHNILEAKLPANVQCLEGLELENSL